MLGIFAIAVLFLVVVPYWIWLCRQERKKEVVEYEFEVDLSRPPAYAPNYILDRSRLEIFEGNRDSCSRGTGQTEQTDVCDSGVAMGRPLTVTSEPYREPELPSETTFR